MTRDGDLQTWTEDELDRTLDDLLALSSAEPPASRATPARAGQWRWAAPILAAAAVIAVVAVSVLPQGRSDAAAARALSIRAGFADVGGVRFPVPAGWTVAVTSADDDAVTACVAAAPAPTCDGVLIVMAVPGAPALSSATTGGVLDPRCPAGGGIVMVEPTITLGDRTGAHYFGGSCSIDGPQAHAWVTNDLSLAITTPNGRWADQGAAVAAGLDLSHWPRDPGPVLVYPTVASGLLQPTG